MKNAIILGLLFGLAFIVIILAIGYPYFVIHFGGQ